MLIICRVCGDRVKEMEERKEAWVIVDNDFCYVSVVPIPFVFHPVEFCLCFFFRSN